MLDDDESKKRLARLVREKSLTYVNEVVSPRSGALYTGYVDRDGTKIGHGSQIWPDGGQYEGEWAGGKANGKGSFHHADGDVYEGSWRDDKAFGHGLYLHADGAKYLGDWKDDVQHGHGQETWADGSMFEG